MDQHDELNGQSHQDTQYVNKNKSRSRRSGTKWKDNTNISPRFQSARHEMRQNFEHHEIQPLIAISPRPLYGRRRGDHQWKYEPLHEAQKNFGYEDQSGTKRRSKQRNWDRVTDREMRLKQADRSSHQGHVPLDDRKHGDLGQVPLDDWKHGDLGRVPLAVLKHGNLGHVASNKWNHGDQGPVPLDDQKHGDQGPVPLDDRKHGDLGHVLLDDRKHGDLGHVPLDDRNHGHASSDDRKSGDQGAAYADGQAWENCTRSVMEFLRSVRPHYQNQAPYANEKSGDGDDETNCTANEVKAGKIESPRVQQGDNLKEDNNDASGGAGKAMVGEGLTEFAGDGHDETHSTANKVKTEKIHSPNVEQDDEAKGSRKEYDCNVGKNEANGGAGKAMSNESLTEFAGDGHDTCNSTANKVNTRKKKSPKPQKVDDLKDNKNNGNGAAGKVMNNESLAEFGGDGQDKTNPTANKVKHRKVNSPNVQQVGDLKNNKNNGSGAPGKVMNNESLTEFGGDGHDKTNPTANKVKTRQIKSPNVQQVDDLKDNKNKASGGAGKVMGDGHSSRGGKNTIRYIPGQEMAEIEQRAGQGEDTYNEV